MQATLFNESLPAALESVEAVNQELFERGKARFPDKVFVFGSGDTNADVVLVGESPGPPDIVTKKPFSGPTGDLLRKILASVGLKDEECYLTNIVKFISQGDEITNETITFFTPYLYREILAVDPRLIISLGNSATKALIKKKDSISKVRGKFYDFEGIKVMPTFNPAYVLRDPTKKREVWEDMKMVRDFLK